MSKPNCHYVGLPRDPLTCHAFPSEHNYCHKGRVPRPVDLEYQEAACISNGFRDCPIYTGIAKALPAAKEATGKRSRYRLGCIFGLMGILSLVVTLAFYSLTGVSGEQSLMVILGQPTRESFYTLTPILSVTVQPTVTSTAAIQLILLPTQTATIITNIGFPLMIRQPTATPLPTLTFTPSPTITEILYPTKTARTNVRPTQVWYFPQPTKRPAKPVNTAVPAPPAFRPTATP